MKKKSKNKKINFYWIYLIFIIGLIGLQIFSSFIGNYENIDETKFLKFLNDGDIEKLQIVNREFAEVYIKTTELNNSNHQQKKLHQLGPHYKVEILDIKSFRELIIEHNQKNPENTIEFPNTSRNTNWTSDLLS